MIVLNALCTVAGEGGTETVPVAGFCTGPGQTVLGPGQVLVSIRFPPPAPNSGAAYLRFIPRHEMDIAVAGAGAQVQFDDDHARFTDARIALSAVASTPLLVDAASACFVGQAPGEEAYAQAAQLAQDAARPITDARGTAAQRRHLVGVLVKRALRLAVQRALGEGGPIDG